MSTLSLREAHSFEAAGQEFLYLVPSAGVFALDDCSSAVLAAIRNGACDEPSLVAVLQAGLTKLKSTEAVAELRRVRAIGDSAGPPPKILPLRPVPLQTLVVNVTNQCNLSCTYCYDTAKTRLSIPKTATSRSS